MGTAPYSSNPSSRIKEAKASGFLGEIGFPGSEKTDIIFGKEGFFDLFKMILAQYLFPVSLNKVISVFTLPFNNVEHKAVMEGDGPDIKS